MLIPRLSGILAPHSRKFNLEDEWKRDADEKSRKGAKMDLAIQMAERRKRDYERCS